MAVKPRALMLRWSVCVVRNREEVYMFSSYGRGWTLFVFKI